MTWKQIKIADRKKRQLAFLKASAITVFFILFVIIMSGKGN